MVVTAEDSKPSQTRTPVPPGLQRGLESGTVRKAVKTKFTRENQPPKPAAIQRQISETDKMDNGGKGKHEPT